MTTAQKETPDVDGAGGSGCRDVEGLLGKDSVFEPAAHAANVTLTQFSGSETNKIPGAVFSLRWDELETWLRKRTTTASKGKTGYFCGSEIKGERADANAGPATILISDYEPPGAADWSSWPCEILAYSTSSHRVATKQNPTAGERWRVLLRLAEPIPPEHYANVRAALQLPEGAAVRAISQPAFFPTSGERTEFASRPGEALDWRALVENMPPRPITGAPECTGEVTECVLYKMYEAVLPAGVGHIVGDKAYVRCLWDDEHSDPDAPINSSTVIMAGEPGTIGVYKCLHAHCEGRGTKEARELLEQDEAARDVLAVHDEAKERAAEAQLDVDTAATAANDTTPEPAAPGPAWRLLGDAELLEDLGPIDWLVEDLELAPGAPSIWAGYGFSGKTLAAQDLAVAVATGSHLWGMPVRQGRVIHLDYEQGRRLTAARYQKLLRGRGLEGFGGNLKVGVLPPFRLGAAAEKTLVEMCTGRALLVIDSLRAAAPGDLEENSSEFRAPLDMLTRVSEATGCAVVVIHHARKPAKDNTGGAKMSLRGSGAIFDASAAVLVFSGEKDRPTKVTMEKARITGECRPDFDLVREDVSTPAGIGLRMRIVGGAELDEVKATPTQTEMHILEVVRQHRGCSKNLVHQAVGGKRGVVMSAIESMLLGGRLWNGGTQANCRLYDEDPMKLVHEILTARHPDGATVASLSAESRLPIPRVRAALSVLQEQRRVFAANGTGDDQRWGCFGE